MARVGAPCNVMQQASGRQFAKSYSLILMGREVTSIIGSMASLAMNSKYCNKLM